MLASTASFWPSIKVLNESSARRRPKVDVWASHYQWVPSFKLYERRFNIHTQAKVDICCSCSLQHQVGDPKQLHNSNWSLMNMSSQFVWTATWFQLGCLYIDNYDIFKYTWLGSWHVWYSLYTYRIQPPLQRLHIGHLHSKHVTATSLIVFDFVSSCTVEFDVEIRNHFWIWSKYTWEDAPACCNTFFLHFSPGFILQWRSVTRSCSTTWGPWKKPATWQLLAAFHHGHRTLLQVTTG